MFIRYKKWLLILLSTFLFAAPSILCGQHKIYPFPGEGTSLPDTLPTAPTGYPDLDLFYRQLSKNTYNEVNSRRRELLKNIPLEKYMEAYEKRGIEVLRDTVSLFDFLVNSCTPFSIEELRGTFIEQISETARKRNNPRLNLVVDFFRGELISIVHYDQKMKWLENVIRKSQKAKDNYLATYTLARMWTHSFLSQHWAQSFVYARQLEEALDRIDDNYPIKGIQYIGLGLSYYSFKDYDRAIPLIHKGLAYRDSSHFLFAGNYLKAWNYLAIYHQMNNEPDSATYYNRLIIKSPEGTACIPAHAAIALCNLGRIEQQKGDTDTAIALLVAGLDYMENHHRDVPFITGIYTSLGECYLAKGDIATTKEYIDKAYHEVNKYSGILQENRLKDLYALESGYYAHVGQHRLSKAFLDSALVASTRYEQLSGQHIVLRGEQELQEAKAKRGKEQVKQQQRIILTISGFLCLLIAILFVVLRLYRKKNAAYAALAAQAIEWSRQSDTTIKKPVIIFRHKDTPPTDTLPVAAKEEPTDEDRRIMSLIEWEMTKKQAYCDANLSAESLAERLGIHRNALSKAINRTTDANYTQYVNGYRIKEAVRIISQNTHKDLYIDELYERVGFSNRSSFYRAFKQFTGLSPAEFRKNATTAIHN